MGLDVLSEMTELPMVDVYESPEELQLRIDLPGVTSQTLTIDATDQTITIKARREKPPRRVYDYRQEGRPLFLDSTIPVPPAVDPTAASASLKRGVLTLTLPKRSGTQTILDSKPTED